MLFKNAKRTLGKRFVQLILLGLIVAMSSFIYTIIDYSIKGLLGPAEEFFTATNQEDFSISMYDVLYEEDITYISENYAESFAPLSPEEWPYTLSGVAEINQDCFHALLDERLAKIKEAYPDIDLEVRESKSVYTTSGEDSFLIFYMRDMQTIDKSEIVSGTKPLDNNEIAISQKFAENNNLEIGDVFIVANRTYTITGFVLFPDYNLAFFSHEFIIDNSSQTFALVTDDEFENIDATVGFEIGGVYNDGYSESEFTTSVIDTYKDNDDLSFISSISLTINNLRSGGIYSDIKGGRVEGIFMSLLIASIGLMIVAIMVSRVIKSQRGPIGILKSMGYSNAEIAKPYVLLIAIMSLPAILVGYFLGEIMAEPLKQMFLSFYLLPSQPIEASWETILIAIIVPFVFIVGLSYLIIRKLLNQSPVSLLSPEMVTTSKTTGKAIGKLFKNMKITRKLRQLLMYRNMAKTVVYVVGMFFAAFLILLSFSMTGIFQRMIYDYYDEANYNYIGYCDYVGTCPLGADAEGVIEITNVSVNDENMSLFGIDPDSVMFTLLNSKNKDITNELENGAIVSEAAHLGKGIDIGDILTIWVGDDSFDVSVIGIAMQYIDERVYVDITTLSEFLTDTSTYYNTVYSANELSNDDYLATVYVQDIVEQARKMNAFMDTFVYMMVGVSVVIGAIIVYILTVMTIEDNFYNISLFKVIGYSEKEIDRMILGGYLSYGFWTFILTIPISIYVFAVISNLFAKMFDVQFPIQFYVWHGAICIITYLLIFYLGALSAKKHLKKISLQEAMKMYEI